MIERDASLDHQATMPRLSAGGRDVSPSAWLSHHHRELELTLQLPPGSAAILQASPAVAGAPAALTHQVTTYFDTADGSLLAAGFVLQLCEIGGLHVQRVTAGANRRGLASNRRVWTWPADDNLPALSELARIKPLARAAQAAEGRLLALSTSEIDRSTRLFHLPHDTIVAACFDDGRIRAGAASEAVSELKLSLCQGRVEELYRLAARLQRLAPMWLSTATGSARGRHLLTRQTAGGTTAKTPKLTPPMSAGDGLRLIIGGALGHLTSNIPPTLYGDPEGVHQMRGALRGCRAALQLFAPLLDAAAVSGFDLELQQLGRLFGTARDLYVFCRQTLPAAMAELSGARLWDMQQLAEDQQNRAQLAVTEAVRGQNFTAMVLNLAAWAQQAALRPCPVGDGAMEKPLITHLSSLLDRAAAKVAKRGRHLGRLSPVARHSLRKSLDKLCDDLKFIAPLYPHHDIERYRAKCETAQAILGVLNDAEITRQLAAGLVGQGRPDLGGPAAALTKWSDLRARKSLRELPAAYENVRAARAFWHGGQG